MPFPETFLKVHTHPVNRVCHGLAALCFLKAAGNILTGRWKKALSMTITGSLMIGIGHAVEGEPPAFVKHWRRKPRKVPRKPRRRTQRD